MAPTNSKRTDPAQNAYFKENGRQSHNIHQGYDHLHSKENSKSATKTVKSNKELEILDFHESWLEEMELYKDQLYIHNQGIQNMLKSHNHMHTLQGSQLSTPLREKIKDDVNGYPKDITGLLNAAAAMTSDKPPSINLPRSKAGFEHKSISGSTDKTQKPLKSRVVIRNANVGARNTSSPNTATGTNSLASSHPTEMTQGEAKPNANGQTHLKRNREENPIVKVSSPNYSKRTNHGTQASHGTHGSTSAGNTEHYSGQNTTKSGTGAFVPSSAGAKPTSKVVVNPFHATSLLSSHHLKETRNILTQNGLTRSAATAYETSLYASNYLMQENVSAANNLFTTNHNRDYGTYIGVSLAGETTKDSLKADDDPCAAIDDVHAYSDTSESDEEYQGQPFFLEGDGLETKQSLFVRDPSEATIAITSECTEIDMPSSVSHPQYYRPDSILTTSLFPNVPPYLNFSSHVERGPAIPTPLHRVLKWKLSPVMPKIVKRVVLNSGFRIIKNTTDWMAVWEKHMKSPGFRTIRSHQKYNHMPGSFRIGRKDTMWRSIFSNMRKYGTKEFGFMQRSYIMPDDLEDLRQAWPKNASKLTKWIVKPPASARGTGIRIVNKWSQFPKDRPLVVQKYIERPLLINDNKFDMRIYVFITSINPLRIYMYKDGLARFASVKYSSELNTLDDRCMHLTNYSINKYSQNYTKNEDYNECQGHKWTLQSLWSCLEKRGVNTKRLWATLRNLVIKAIISGESGLNRMYRQNVNFRYNCYELFGFDVLLDDNLVPWLLEINISPSLHSELPLDLHVKGPLIQAILNTALYQVPPKLNEKQQREILEELKMDPERISLCLDKRIFTTCLTPEEVRKHNHFTNRTVEFREEYIDSILENLLPDDVRCLIIAEDEFARSKPLERIFPTSETHPYLKYIENPRYYNRLVDAWEHRYGHCREKGIAILSRLCESGYHLEVSDATSEKEPNVSLTEIDMLHVRKSEERVPNQQTAATTIDINIGDSIVRSLASNYQRSQQKQNVASSRVSPDVAGTYIKEKQ